MRTQDNAGATYFVVQVPENFVFMGFDDRPPVLFFDDMRSLQEVLQELLSIRGNRDLFVRTDLRWFDSKRIVSSTVAGIVTEIHAYREKCRNQFMGLLGRNPRMELGTIRNG